jgi:hypothetical protein
MIRIVLNKSQILAMKAEVKKTEKAHRDFEPGALLFQVWPKEGVMDGKFIPHEMAVEVIKVLRQK